jgi:DNA invertase Pin-like site-specific DNA recombinase
MKKQKAVPPDGTRLIGYARVSTDDQDLSAQTAALTRRGVLPDDMYSDKASGVARRRGLALAFKALREGDTLIVWKLDRLGRDLIDLLTRLKWLRDNKIGFESLTEVVDGSTPQGRFTAAILGANAQYEREVIAERTQTTMQYLKGEGRTFGRKAILGAKQMTEIQKQRNAGVAVSVLAKQYKVSRATIRNHSRRPKRR